MMFAALIFLFLLVTSGSGDAQTDWKTEWEKTREAAKKEGKINLYVGRYGQAELLKEFSREFPEIRVVTVNGTGNQLGTRILAEIRAGKVIADIFSGGPNSNFNLLYKGRSLAPIKSAFILPEVLDETKWWGKKHTYNDPEQQYIFIYVGNAGSRGQSYNSKLVSPAEFNSYWDLANPRWRGKIVSQRPTETGLGANLQFLYYQPDLGPEFMRRLFGTMEVTFGDRRTITDWLALGKYALCIGCRQIEQAKSQGLPVDEFDTTMWKEGQPLSTGGGSISLIKGGPNPNAAKVFINWFLSRRGQIALQQSKDLYGELPPNSRRIDIPKDTVPPEYRLVEGAKYLDVARPEFSDMAPIFQLAKEIMRARERKE